MNLIYYVFEVLVMQRPSVVVCLFVFYLFRTWFFVICTIVEKKTKLSLLSLVVEAWCWSKMEVDPNKLDGYILKICWSEFKKRENVDDEFNLELK